MKEKDIELVVERASEAVPGVSPRLTSDNGPQFVARDFKEYVGLCGMSPVRTSPFYPQSNGKIESWHKTLKRECIWLHAPQSLADAHRLVGDFVSDYNNRRLHSAINYVTPADRIVGRDAEILRTRDERIENARAERRLRRAQGAVAVGSDQNEAQAG